MSGAPVSLVEAVEEFLRAQAADGLRPATLRWYRSILKGFCESYQAQEQPRVISYNFCQSAFNQGDVSAPRCPRCHSDQRQIKVGRNESSGSQRFKCQHCKRKYTPIEVLPS